MPDASIELYKNSEWSQFGNIVAIPEVSENRCATPTITFMANGKIKVECATEGATCVTNITASNTNPITDNEISLNTPLTTYTVTAYAKAEGYEDSEVATSTFQWERTEGDVNDVGRLDIGDVVQLVNMILAK